MFGLNFQYKGVNINQIDRFLKFIYRIDGIKEYIIAKGRPRNVLSPTF